MFDFLINSFNFLAAKCTLFSPKEYELIRKLYVFILVVTPVTVLALCTFDMAKAVVAQDENAIKKAQNNAIKRLIAGAALFFVPILLNVILGAVSGDIDLGGTCVSQIADK